jgi:hypothetical protein
VTVPLPPSGPPVVDLAFPVPKVLGELVLPLQCAHLDPPTLSVALGNLELARVVDF